MFSFLCDFSTAESINNYKLIYSSWNHLTSLSLKIFWIGRIFIRWKNSQKHKRKKEKKEKKRKKKKQL